MDFDVRVALGDMELSPEEVEALLAGQDGLLQFLTISYPSPTPRRLWKQVLAGAFFGLFGVGAVYAGEG